MSAPKPTPPTGTPAATEDTTKPIDTAADAPPRSRAAAAVADATTRATREQLATTVVASPETPLRPDALWLIRVSISDCHGAQLDEQVRAAVAEHAPPDDVAGAVEAATAAGIALAKSHKPGAAELELMQVEGGVLQVHLRHSGGVLIAQALPAPATFKPAPPPTPPAPPPPATAKATSSFRASPAR